MVTLPTQARPSGLLGLGSAGGQVDGLQRERLREMNRNSQIGLRQGLIRACTDFGLAMGLIWLVSLGTPAHHGRTFVFLSLTVAATAALNLAFLRHLRRVYASQRRGVWRRE